MTRSAGAMGLDQVASYHLQLTARLQAVLGAELVGVYAGGSIALGGYTPGRSDLDVAAVCRGPLQREQKELVGQALRHESLPCPARGLEFVLYPAAVARVPTPEAGFELDLNSGARMPFRLAFDGSDVPRHWYLIDRAIVRAHGKVLSGPPAPEVFGAIPRPMLLPVLAEAVRWYDQTGEAPDDAVLNACRAWRFAEEGEWSAKRDAGRWALDHLDRADVVADALAVWGGGGELPRAPVERFLREMAERLDEAARQA